jgi:Bacterial SH3 domain
VHISPWKKLGTAAAVAASTVVLGLLGAAPVAAHQDPADQGGRSTSASASARPGHDDPRAGHDDHHGRQGDPGDGKDHDVTLGRVVSDAPLNIRRHPTTKADVIGTLQPGAIIKIACKVAAERVDGNPIWYKLAGRPGWVSARYVRNLGYVPYCS